MTTFLPILIPFLIVFAIIIAGLFLTRAWDNRTNSVRAPYNVGQHEARKAMRLNVMRAFSVIALGVILLGLFFYQTE